MNRFYGRKYPAQSFCNSLAEIQTGPFETHVQIYVIIYVKPCKKNCISPLKPGTFSIKFWNYSVVQPKGWPKVMTGDAVTVKVTEKT